LSRRVLWAAVGAGAAAAVSFAGPPLLRDVAAFRVREIEVLGARQLPPRVVAAALRLRPGASVFDATAPLGERVRALPGVLEALRVSHPYKLVSREVKPDDTVVKIGDGQFGGGRGCDARTRRRRLINHRAVRPLRRADTVQFAFDGNGVQAPHRIGEIHSDEVRHHVRLFA